MSEPIKPDTMCLIVSTMTPPGLTSCWEPLLMNVVQVHQRQNMTVKIVEHHPSAIHVRLMSVPGWSYSPVLRCRCGHPVGLLPEPCLKPLPGPDDVRLYDESNEEPVPVDVQTP